MDTAETKLTAVVTERVLANLAEFWEHPVPGRFSQRMPQRIAGGPHDQAVPEGTQNPYWEIVRQLPLTSIPNPWSRRPEPDAYWFGPGEELRQFADRHSLCTAFSWAIPSPGDVAWIKARLGGRGIVEPGAGHGYWAWQLAQAGVDVVAYEPVAPEDNTFVTGEPWSPVLPGDHDAVKAHPDRSLLLCWPSYSEPWASWALANYAGDQLFYAGEGEGGCCADDGFFRLLEAEWEDMGDSPSHISYHGIHCYLTEYRRKG